MNSQALAFRFARVFSSLCILILVPMGRALAQIPTPMRVDVAMTTHHWGGSYDGTSWSVAIGYLQEAIDNQLPGGQIWVKEGLYNPTPGSLGFTITKQLSLYGGFAGTETSVAGRSGSFAGTILEGNTFEHAVYIPQVSGSSIIVIDGFTIEKGHSSGVGGGIICLGWDLDLTNCFVKDNVAINQGGGLYFDGTATAFHSLRIKECEFRSNFVDDFDGGGIYATQVRGKAVNSYFLQNSAERWGGGVFLGSMNSPDRFDFTDDVFWLNTVRGAAPIGKGGGIYLDSAHANTTVVNCSFADNSCADIAGGQVLYFSGAAQARLYNSILYFNNFGSGIGNPALVGGALAEYSDIQMTSGTVYGGSHNINFDPMFQNHSLGRLRLKFDPFGTGAVSPCVDRADYSRLPTDDLDVDGDGNTAEFIDIDLDGVSRHTDLNDTFAPNLGSGTYPYMDLGAYEHS